MSNTAAAPCPCGSGSVYGGCCQRLHQGEPAANAEALMRSRYTAFVYGLQDYLLSSWDARTRPAELPLDTDTHWFGLTVHEVRQNSTAATVSFSARFREGRGWFCLSEVSEFVLSDDGHWRYVMVRLIFSRCIRDVMILVCAAVRKNIKSAVASEGGGCHSSGQDGSFGRAIPLISMPQIMANVPITESSIIRFTSMLWRW